MKKSKIAMALALSAVLFAGCASGAKSEAPEASVDNPGSEAPAASTDEPFNIILNAQPTGFNPLTTNDSMSSDINIQIYDTLYNRTQDGTSYEPNLALDFPESSEDGLSATIKLRDDVSFSNGEKFNAETVKFTIERIKDKEYGSARASIAASIESVEVLGEYEVKLNLSYPDGVLVAKFAHMNSAMISPNSDGVALMTEPVGTGPYVMTEAVAGSEYVLEYNENYWGEEPDIKKVVFTVVAEASTAISRLETAEADFMPVVPLTNVNRVKNIPGVNFVTSPSSQITYLGLRTDTAKNPELMSNEKVRQAMLMAIDRASYVETLEGNVLGTNSILPSTVFGYKEEAENYGYAFDLEAAKAAVAEAGVADEPVVILTSTVQATQTVAEYIQASLKEAGFNNVELLPQEFATYLDTAKQPNAFDLAVLTWANVTGDGTEFFDPNLHSVNSSQRVQYKNEAFDQYVDESRETMDMDVRLEKLDAANELALKDAVVVPLYNPFNTFAFSEKYENVTILPGTYFKVQHFKLVK
ncbi:MAG: hypothetical protein EOM07_03940 [Clostridia bacterium]|nr:hypothetical protein [Clostridia bacterium]